MTPFPGAAALLRDGIAARAFPAASIEVGRREEVLWRASFGALTYEEEAPSADAETIFDLASITKVLATTTLTMRAADEGLLTLDDRVADWIPDWRAADREQVTLRDLLTHSSGLTAYLPFFRDHTGRVEFQQAIATMPLEYEPRTQSLYSDLGFILLGFILEDARSRASQSVGAGAFDPVASLAAQFGRIATLVTDEPLTYLPSRAWRSRIAPTEYDPWRGRTLVGEVHDENAWALGGVAGHAGLFGTGAGVGAFARATLHTIAGDPILARSATMRQFIERSDGSGGSRALGWDTMLASSSCGQRMSSTAIGHTGFTGTSLWIDWERDLYVVLLTNRVHPTRENSLLKQLRPRVHDAVFDGVP
ncbi:MAG: serine hydrolase domain-containing protein [Vicinamibacterales bacterium]